METVIIPPSSHAEKVERLKAVLAAIEANPGHWNQEHWHCGTSHCFAGFAECIGRQLPVSTDEDAVFNTRDERQLGGDTTEEIAACYLGLEAYGGLADALFDPENTLEDLRSIVSAIAAEGE